MDFSHIVFLISAAVILVSALMVVTVRQMRHAAYFLVLAFLGVAVIYTLLEANFFSLVQILIYVGAIAILIIFAVMLSSREQEEGGGVNKNWWMVAFISILLFMALMGMISSQDNFSMTASPLPQEMKDIGALGLALVDIDGFVLPFEVSSILLVAALIGAIFIGSERKGGKK